MLHYIGGDYSLTSDIILLVHVSNGIRVVIGTRGSTWWQNTVTCPEEALWLAWRVGVFRRANWFGPPRGSRSWAVDFRESGRILAYSEECMNPRCKLCNGTLWCLWSYMIEDRTCLVNDIWWNHVERVFMWLVELRDWYSGVGASEPPSMTVLSRLD